MDSSDPAITDCTFSGNSVGGSGGGMYIFSSSPIIRNCTFSGNSVTQSYAMGGGIYNKGSSPVMTNCIFNGNTVSGPASSKGGAMYNQCSSPFITNCSFTLNRAESESGHSKAGGIFNDTSSPVIVNTILWGNSAAYSKEIYNTPLDITFSNVDQYPFENDGARGNLRADPLFADPEDGDLSLLEDSPCIDSGYEAAAWLPPTDFFGNPRILGNAPDMGAIEWLML